MFQDIIFNQNSDGTVLKLYKNFTKENYGDTAIIDLTKDNEINKNDIHTSFP